MAARQPKSVPLREWMGIEAKTRARGQGNVARKASRANRSNESIIRKLTVAYGISELLRRLTNESRGATGEAVPSWCRIDNFAVRVSNTETNPGSSGSKRGTDAEPPVMIEGVEMSSPEFSLQINEPSFLSGSSLGDPSENKLGRYLEVEFLHELPPADPNAALHSVDESEVLYSLGVLFHELFSHPDISQVEARVKGGKIVEAGSDRCQEPAKKKRAISGPADERRQHGEISTRSLKRVPLQELGFPFSLSLLVQNLLDCRLQLAEAYNSLNTLSSDLHLLLLEPDRFLFGVPCAPNNDGKVQLQFRREKLYGRETEVSQIQEAFCRVSAGQSEAFFVGGFSGSGKTRLVESLRMQVDVAGGYVVTRKFDAISKERPLLEVVSAFNDLCVLIKEKNSPQDLGGIARLLVEEFGSDISVLARLLPNIMGILPRMNESGKAFSSDCNQSVGFILQRFTRIVSSKEHPLMLFLDDLQWCDISTMAVIEGILSNKESCLFFVGSYRNNEVQHDHSIYRFIDNLEQCNVPFTKLSLSGINYNDLNTMISDATGLFPRLCSNLSDIIFQKTKGNPFFLLEFLRSLVDGGLLEYSVRKRRWIWDENAIAAMDITDNVLFLLANKMSALSEEVISILKVVSCFGTAVHSSVIEFLGYTEQYSTIQEGVEKLRRESLMVALDGDIASKSKTDGSTGRTWKFVHDKVREAAYSLIDEQDKDDYYKNLGRMLYSVCRGKTLGEAVLPIVDQVNRGLQSAMLTHDMCIDVAELNLEAGLKCFHLSDYSTANNYLTYALSLLPENSWDSQYNLSLQLYFLSARSAYSCGNGKKACEALYQILKEGRCIQDKVDAYFLLVNIFHAQEECEQAYLTCIEVLTNLGENVPELEREDVSNVVETTAKKMENKSEEELLTIKGDGSIQVSSILKFYSSIIIAAFYVKPEMQITFCCRMIELTLAQGVTKYSLIGFLLFAVHLCQHGSVKVIPEASRIGKLAISMLSRFEAPDIVARVYFLHYGLVAHYTDPIQSCIKYLRKGFEVGMTNGDSFSAFFSAKDIIRCSLFGGTNLKSLLQEVDYYLTILEQHERLGNLIKGYFLVYRETITMLIDKEPSIKNVSGEAESSTRLSETIYFQKTLQSFWLGYHERSHHYALKLLEMSECGSHHMASYPLSRETIAFYRGISSFMLLGGQKTSKLLQIPKQAIVTLKAAAQHSKWNYGNKVHLLSAELASYEGRNDDAETSYAAALLSARSSRFTHERGLACELAGFHYKKIGNERRARRFFNGAKECYSDWGSKIKVDYINRQLDLLRS